MTEEQAQHLAQLVYKVAYEVSLSCDNGAETAELRDYLLQLFPEKKTAENVDEHHLHPRTTILVGLPQNLPPGEYTFEAKGVSVDRMGAIYIEVANVKQASETKP